MALKLILSTAVLACLLSCSNQSKPVQKQLSTCFDSLTVTPPMGWNSWDCLGLDANEEQIKKVADYMDLHLKKFGWQYIVIDAGWYHSPELKTAESRIANPIQNLDQYGRLIPDTIKYPSSKAGIGFKALADYIHSKGLKFGIHVMRGIPWNAIRKNTLIEGTNFHAADIANLMDTCKWSNIMKGVNMDKEGAQEYYNSVYKLYAQWGVDFVKVDDISNPYHKAEIEGVHQAIVNSGAPIILSLSPGPAPLSEWGHLAKNANMWRISGDFWDDWKWLKKQFEYCSKWDSINIPGHWPDADMLPIGKLRITGGDDWIASQLGATKEEVSNEYSRFSDTEKYTLMTLWCIFKSPLMLGGYLPENDSVTFKIITNEEVLAVGQYSTNNRQVKNKKGIVVWMADAPGSDIKYLAVFNTNDKLAHVSLYFDEIGLKGTFEFRNLWERKNLGNFKNVLTTSIIPHGCVIYSIKSN